MAEEKSGDLCHVTICKVENGYKVSCSYDSPETLSSKAGWVPRVPGECKEYVEKSKAAVIKRLEEVL